eukprot:5296530-Amphidinium_carterae.1
MRDSAYFKYFASKQEKGQLSWLFISMHEANAADLTMALESLEGAVQSLKASKAGSAPFSCGRALVSHITH